MCGAVCSNWEEVADSGPKEGCHVEARDRGKQLDVASSGEDVSDIGGDDAGGGANGHETHVDEGRVGQNAPVLRRAERRLLRIASWDKK